MGESGGISLTERLAMIDAKLDRLVDHIGDTDERMQAIELERGMLSGRVMSLESNTKWITRLIVGAVVTSVLVSVGLRLIPG